MNVRAIGAVLAILTITGCASIIDGKHQTMTLSTKGNIDKQDTECELRNTKGAWTTDHKESIVVRRDYGDLIVNCENNEQEGELVIESDVSVGFMALNFIIWDFCTLSCIVDHSTGALYEYPLNISVPMRNKAIEPAPNAPAKTETSSKDQSEKIGQSQT